jgi:hypothetical protein
MATIKTGCEEGFKGEVIVISEGMIVKELFLQRKQRRQREKDYLPGAVGLRFGNVPAQCLKLVSHPPPPVARR